ncbi:MAG: hypothetical protein N4A45_01100 [Flavobacteriales bacterium]|jgi:hypothetical protein|nr:hypothetical protein [Flavobacteriales bacterium]
MSKFGIKKICLIISLISLSFSCRTIPSSSSQGVKSIGEFIVGSIYNTQGFEYYSNNTASDTTFLINKSSRVFRDINIGDTIFYLISEDSLINTSSVLEYDYYYNDVKICGCKLSTHRVILSNKIWVNSASR